MRDLAVGLGLTNCFGFGLISTPCLAASFNSLSSFMEFTCLSHGNGLYFPPCHILDICGVRVLLDCPIDLSSLTIFSPVTINPNRNVDNENRGIVGKTLDANSFICGEPLYRTVKNLEQFNASFIDVVLISNPNGMFGLPFLMRASDFNAKVYATKAAARIGQLLMEDLVHMHREFKHVYGHGGSSAPKWLKWDELDLLPEELKQIVLGQDGTKFGRWAPLYSAADVKACMLKVECLNLAEEVCYDGTLIIKPYSSGLEIGSCNWTISSSKGSFAWLSNASFSSASPMSFDYAISGAADVILLSDFTCLTSNDESFNADISSVSRDGTKSEENASFQGGQGYADEIEKLDFICSCSVDALKDGGSVLIPIGRLWVILQLLDQLSLHLESRDVKVPIYVISSVAEELLSFTSVIPECLSQQKQDQLYSGGSLFSYLKMLKDGKLRIFPAIHSQELLKTWQEPCIVFCPHWSLRLGPVVPLLRRWSRDKNSLIVLEEDVDASLGLLPFSPIEMKVLQCSFTPELQVHKTRELLKMRQPGHVLLPEAFRKSDMAAAYVGGCSYYAENVKIRVPYREEDPIVELENLSEEEVGELSTTRLKGELLMEGGRYIVRNRPKK